MTPEQKIKRHILKEAGLHVKDGIEIDITSENIDDLWEDGQGEDGCNLQDSLSEFRGSGEETGLSAPYSRHYEVDSVGRQLSDGTWVGWAYWYGGGKHGEPEAIDWMEDAYELHVTEKEQTVVVRTFKQKEEAA